MLKYQLQYSFLEKYLISDSSKNTFKKSISKKHFESNHYHTYDFSYF